MESFVNMSEMSDHDLLVQLHENIKLNFAQVKADIKDLKDGTATQLTDHEIRLRFLERWVWGAIAVLTVATIVIGWLVTR